MNASIENTLEETKTANKLESLVTLYSTRLDTLAPITAFTQIPALGARFAHPPSIKLCGQLIKCRARPYQPEFGYLTYDLQPEEDGLYTNRKRCNFHPDLPMTKETTELYCLLIKREHRRKQNINMTSIWDLGVVLRPTDATALKFRRVGLYHEKMIDSMCSWRQQPAIAERVAKYDHEELELVECMKLHMIMFAFQGPDVAVEIV